MRPTPRRFAGPAALAALFALSGCSVILDVDDDCTTDGDCAAGQRCEQNLCVAGDPPDTQPGLDAGLDAGDANTGAPEPRPVECRSTYAVGEGELFEDGFVVFADDIIRVGMLMPTTGDLGPVGLAIEQAAALAAEEINETGGVDGARIGIIACDTATDPAQAQRLAGWLIESAGVEAIIGPATSSGTLEVFTNVARPTGTLLVSPSATSPAISDLDDDDLMWRTVPSDAIQGRAILALLEVRAYQKIAMIYLDDAYGRGLFNAVQLPLCERGRCDDDTFLAQPYTADEDGIVPAGQVNTLMEGLQAFDPDVLVLVGFVEAGISILNAAALSQFLDTPIVLTDGMQNSALMAQVSSEVLLRNIIGTAPASPDGALFQAFRNRYRGKWGKDPEVYNAQAYDAMYLIGFAIAASGDAFTGADLAANLKRMSAGETVRAVADDWNKGVRILREGADATFDFEGTSGPLTFDNARGEAPGDIEGWYLNLEDRTVESLGVIYTSDGMFRQFVNPNESEPEPEPGDMGM